MDKKWEELCAAQHVPVLGGEPGHNRFSEVGMILIKDHLGGIAPLGSFDICDKAGTLAVFPCHILNSRDKEQLLAVSMGLMMAWGGVGAVTFRFAAQSDGPEYALLEVTEGANAFTGHYFTLRGLSENAFMENLSNKGTVEGLGFLPGLPEAGVAAADRLYQGGRLSDIFASLPKELLNRETMTAWYARLAWPEESHAG